MGIIESIKSLLGVDERDRSPTADAGTPVSVEREPATETESAVKGVERTRTTREAEPATSVGTPEADVAGGNGEPVDSLKGIGSAYAERLADAGVHTVTDLAAADADALGEETGIGAGRVDTWIEQARARTR